MIYILGVDPGKTGACAAFDQDHSLRVIRFTDRSEQDIATLMSAYKNTCVSFLENVHAREDDTRHTAFEFGSNTGFIRGVMIANNIQFEKVDPKTWQFEFRLGGKFPDDAARKRAHKAVAQSLFPELKVTLDMADAILIAEYGWRKEYGRLTHGKDPNFVARVGVGVIRTTTRVRTRRPHRDLLDGI